jgi:hypothetical protein
MGRDLRAPGRLQVAEYHLDHSRQVYHGGSTRL